jgi:hypothetical protein
MENQGVQIKMEMPKPEAPAVEVKEENLPVAASANVLPTVPNTAWGAEEISADDILLPKILLMQGLSQAVTDEKARIGDMLDNLNGQVIGDKNTPVEIIVFKTTKTWIIFEDKNNTGSMEYVRQEPMTAANQNWPMEEVMGGLKVRRDRALNFYCLLPSQIASGEAFPYLVSMRRTSYTAGKKLVTYFTKLKLANQPTASRVFALSCKKQENDKGTFYVFDAAMSRQSTPEEIKAAHDWYQIISTATVRVMDTDLEAEAGGIGNSPAIDPETAATRQF